MEGATYIFIGQKIRAELHIVIEIKRATGLESRPEGRHRWGFRKFPHALDATELTLGILLGHFGASTGPAVMVVVAVTVVHLTGMRRVVRLLLLVLMMVVVLLLELVGVQEGGHGERSRENPAPEL